ncbi:uncharacterized protein LOC134235970 [Saccostrea cucullata]|uniref:uncharacterized protein LOC134235970 n=1 Tax=Saccostrea cuccullata TaxID=36930 RepID=UPI002ED294D3
MGRVITCTATNHTINMADNKTVWIQDDRIRQLIRDYMLFCPNQDVCLGPEMINIVSVTTTQKMACSECSCREDCYRKSNCCPSVVHLNNTNDSIKVNDQLICTQTEFKAPGFSYNETGGNMYWMIATCPPSYPNKDILNNCTQNVSLTSNRDVSFYRPVTSAATNETYKNVFCALCHGENRNAIIRWKMFVETDVQKSILDVRETEEKLFELMASSNIDVGVVFLPPDSFKNHTETCFTDYISSCNVSGLWTAYDQVTREACEDTNLISIFTDCTDLYKNVYCAICNQRDPYRSLSYYCPKTISQIIQIPNDTSVILRYSGPSSQLLGHKHGPNCGSGEIYDPKKKSCLQIICESGFVLTGPKCQPVVNEVSEATYILNSFFCFHGELSRKVVLNLIQYDLEHICQTYEELTGLPILTSKWPHCETVSIWYKVMHRHQILSMMERLYKIHRTRPFHRGLVNNLYTSIHPNFSIFINGPEFVNSISSMHYPSKKCLQCSRSPSLTFALAPWQTCPRVLVERSRMYLLHETLSFCFNEYDACINNSYVRVSDDGQYFGVCIDQYLQAVRSTYTGVTSEADGLYSFIVCILLALLACLFHVISTVFLNQNWSSFALSQMGQSLTYFIMNFIRILIRLVFLGEQVCGVLGMIIHFLFLSVSVWSSIACIDLTRSILTLTKSGIREQHRPIRFAAYAAINLALCCLFVVSNTFPNLDADDSLLGYSTSACEISSSMMNAVTLGLPVSISLLVDFVSFIWIYFKVGGIVTFMPCPELKWVKSFLVVAFLVWLSWLLDLLVSVTGVTIFDSLHTMTIGLIGIFMFICYSPAFSDE